MYVLAPNATTVQVLSLNGPKNATNLGSFDFSGAFNGTGLTLGSYMFKPRLFTVADYRVLRPKQSPGDGGLREAFWIPVICSGLWFGCPGAHRGFDNFWLYSYLGLAGWVVEQIVDRFLLGTLRGHFGLAKDVLYFCFSRNCTL